MADYYHLFLDPLPFHHLLMLNLSLMDPLFCHILRNQNNFLERILGIFLIWLSVGPTFGICEHERLVPQAQPYSSSKCGNRHARWGSSELIAT